jgi:hypothetical protein
MGCLVNSMHRSSGTVFVLGCGKSLMTMLSDYRCNGRKENQLQKKNVTPKDWWGIERHQKDTDVCRAEKNDRKFKTSP